MMNEQESKEPKGTMELLSEGATARYAGVSMNAMRRARERGKVAPKQEMLTGVGVCRMYDPAEVKNHFDLDAEFQANRARCRGRLAARSATQLQAA